MRLLSTMALVATLCCSLELHALAEHFAETAPSGSAFYHDIVVYEPTLGGLGAAFAAADMNSSISIGIIANSSHIGGMTTGGLSGMDGPLFPIGGYVADFINNLTNQSSSPHDRSFEPSAATELILNELTKRKNIVIYSMQLGIDSVEVQDKRIKSITTRAGNTFVGKYFVDGSYEGDVVINSGVSYTFGREPSSMFNEPHAGRQNYWFNFSSEIDPYHYTPDGSLMPLVTPPTGASFGSGDDWVQSYNFRLCVTKNATNRVPFPKPRGYNASDFLLLKLFFESTLYTYADGFDEFFLMRQLPSGKADLNSCTDQHHAGPVNTDASGLQWGYPNGSFHERSRIYDQHVTYTQSLLYFLATDASVPAAIQRDANQYGLCKDEFVNNSNWPPQLYVREAIRMVSDVILTENDVVEDGNLTKPTSVGLSRWSIDVHVIQHTAVMDPLLGRHIVANEGRPLPRPTSDVAEVPYEVLIPRRDEVQNLIVPVCISSTHVAFATYRLEPQYLSLGYSSGVALALALEQRSGAGDAFAEQLALQDMDIKRLQEQLVSVGQIIRRQQ